MDRAWIFQVTKEVRSVITVRADLRLEGPPAARNALTMWPFGMITENGLNYVKSAAIAKPSIDECGVSP